MTLDQEGRFLPERRRSAAVRAERLARFADLMAHFKSATGGPPPAVMIETFDVTGSPGERKAQADQIAQRMGATPEWFNGYYMATTTSDGFPVEFHFNPPIFASDMPGAE
jgi:hypothetical protein